MIYVYILKKSVRFSITKIILKIFYQNSDAFLGEDKVKKGCKKVFIEGQDFARKTVPDS